LYANDSFFAHERYQGTIGAIDCRMMAISDWTYRQHLTVDEFHAIVLGENAGFAHAVIVVNRKKSSWNFTRHRRT
jgi:hypothetical protein